MIDARRVLATSDSGGLRSFKLRKNVVVAARRCLQTVIAATPSANHLQAIRSIRIESGFRNRARTQVFQNYFSWPFGALRTPRWRLCGAADASRGCLKKSCSVFDDVAEPLMESRFRAFGKIRAMRRVRCTGKFARRRAAERARTTGGVKGGAYTLR
jgi:hypothetical protein